MKKINFLSKWILILVVILVRDVLAHLPSQASLPLTELSTQDPAISKEEAYNSKTLISSLASSQEDNFFKNQTTLSKISTLRGHLKAGDVLVLDIDNTVLIHQKFLFWKIAQPIESDLSKTIKALQKKGVIVLCLTARSLNRAKKTQKQLKKIGLNITHAIQVTKIPHFPFKNGVIYAPPPSGTSSIKGPVFKKFLDYFRENAHSGDKNVISKNYLALEKIKRVIFVDDRLYNIESFLTTMRQDPTYKQIEFYGLHFLAPKLSKKNSIIQEASSDMQLGAKKAA